MAKPRGRKTLEALGYTQTSLELGPLPSEEGGGEVIQGTLFELNIPHIVVNPYRLEGKNVRPDGRPIRPRARGGSQRLGTTQLQQPISRVPAVQGRGESTPSGDSNYWQDVFDGP